MLIESQTPSDKFEKLDADLKTLWQEIKNCTDFMRNVKDMTNIQTQYDMYRMAIQRFDEVLNRLDAVETKLIKIEEKYTPVDFFEVSPAMIQSAHHESGVLLKNICTKFSIDMSTASRWISGEINLDSKRRFELYKFMKETKNV